MSSCSRSNKKRFDHATGHLKFQKACSLEENEKTKKLAEQGEKIAMDKIPGFKDLLKNLKTNMNNAIKTAKKEKMEGGRRKTKKNKKKK